MRIRPGIRRWLAAAVVGLIVVLAACSAAQTPADEGVAEGAPDGKALMEDRCTKCHTLDRVIGAGKSEAEWQNTVERMIAKGTDLDAGETEILVTYLSGAYGP